MNTTDYPEDMNADNGARARPPQRTLTVTVPDSRTITLSVLAAAAAITVGWLIVTAADQWTGNGWLNALAPILASAAIAATAVTIRRRRRAA